MRNVKITIKGRVFKVGFQYYVKQIAWILSIKGTVKYSGNNKIKIEASGNNIVINGFINYYTLGSHGSNVKKITITENQTEYTQDFAIIPGHLNIEENK